MSIFTPFTKLCKSYTLSSFESVFFLASCIFNTLPWPNNKILELSKSKVLANDRIKAAHMTSSVFDREENIVRNGKNASYQGFLLFSPLMAKPKGTIGLHSVCQSIHPSVRQFQFSGLFSKTLPYINLIFGMEVNLHVLQIKFQFRYIPSIFGEITGLGLGKFQQLNSFPDFLSKRLQILT